ncbi:MAG: hypothetical protein MCM46_11055 [Candidatus Manganitrophus sp. SB1]|nr:hypothetical protein [Candidatus Manganitrophus morganii]
MTSKKLYITLLSGMLAFFSFFPILGISSTGIVQAANTVEEQTLEAVNGKIVAVDPQKKIIRIEPGILGAEKDLMVTDQTKIVIKGQSGNLQGLREGDEVTVRYAENEREERVAEYIEVTG